MSYGAIPLPAPAPAAEGEATEPPGDLADSPFGPFGPRTVPSVPLVPLLPLAAAGLLLLPRPPPSIDVSENPLPGAAAPPSPRPPRPPKPPKPPKLLPKLPKLLPKPARCPSPRSGNVSPPGPVVEGRTNESTALPRESVAPFRALIRSAEHQHKKHRAGMERGMSSQTSVVVESKLGTTRHGNAPHTHTYTHTHSTTPRRKWGGGRADVLPRTITSAATWRARGQRSFALLPLLLLLLPPQP